MFDENSTHKIPIFLGRNWIKMDICWKFLPVPCTNWVILYFNLRSNMLACENNNRIVFNSPYCKWQLCKLEFLLCAKFDIFFCFFLFAVHLHSYSHRYAGWNSSFFMHTTLKLPIPLIPSPKKQLTQFSQERNCEKIWFLLCIKFLCSSSTHFSHLFGTLIYTSEDESEENWNSSTFN